MKLTLNPNRARRGLTLGGLIIGIMLIIVGSVVVFLLLRLCKLKPRELPSEAQQEMEEYSGYESNFASRTWPVHFVPAALDLVTAEPDAPLYEKVLIDNDFLVQKCIDGTLTNWITEFHWIIGGGSVTWLKEDGGADVPQVHGFDKFENEGIIYNMKDDYSGFDIQIDPEVMAAHKSMFWRTTK